MSDGQRCVNGCQSTRTLDDGTVKRVPRLTQTGLLCDPCRQRLASWLAATGIPEDYARLGFVAEPGSVQAAPGSKSGKRANAPVPIRLDVLDLVDDRLGWRSDGSSDRRGVIGLIESWARLVREERRMAIPTAPATLVGECAFLHKQLDWLCTRPWIDEMYREIRTVAKELGAAIGYPWPKPMDCPSCDAPVWLPTSGDTIQCAQCGAYWEKSKWLFLAGVIESDSEAV